MADKLLDIINDYYTRKVREHGASPKGVDWNSEDSQVMRFDQLCRVIDHTTPYSLLDLGCGYGAMYDYFKQKPGAAFSYTGLDISEEMIANAIARNKDDAGAHWKTKLDDNEQFDYIVASGIFNVRLNTPDDEWFQYILDTLAFMNKHSVKGFSFNVLTSYSDKEYMKDYLYYANPSILFDHCKRNFSKQVAILHDYPLYEFTVHVKKIK